MYTIAVVTVVVVCYTSTRIANCNIAYQRLRRIRSLKNG